ncbi:hypothetical protein [Candidatus Laterigemmans baculatus]|uniref:hypothetical protein n=1 Tax=Candidatus Laterigemmans baculatus TaxID=2770505 RepID=UPI0013DA3FDE|nr:hypothetical protein [Candidatus Laterigemmans baculatus]
MNSPLIRGGEVLRWLLEERCFDVRQLDAAEFPDWLRRHQARWERDAAFAQRARLRDLRRSCPSLLQLERELRRATAAEAATASHARRQTLERAASGAEQAIAGLTNALARAAPEDRTRLAEKLESFHARQRTLRSQQEQLTAASPELQNLLRLRDQLHALRADCGVEEVEAELARLERVRGQGTGRSGSTFEHQAESLIEQAILPDLSPPSGEVAILRGVTLGAARLELDAVVVRQPADPAAAVEVLAVVEVKRNLNDLAHGFRHRQENLAWLTGDSAAYDPAAYDPAVYDAGAYRTRRFIRGHFDRPAVHSQAGVDYLFTRESFRGFRRDAVTSLFLDSLYLLTRPGAIWGMPSKALNRLSHRLASDPELDLAEASAVERLLRWCHRQTHDLETPDVLRMYGSSESRARQILFATRPSSGAPLIVEASNFNP